MYIKTSFLLTVLMLVLGNQLQAQSKISSKEKAQLVFKAWEKGESGKSYQDFIGLINEENFSYFSHPLVGSYTLKSAYEKLMALVKEREAKPNQLRFSNTRVYARGNSFCFQFDSEGSVNPGFPYKGFNMIQVEITNNKLTGFREYFGFVDPAWFK